MKRLLLVGHLVHRKNLLKAARNRTRRWFLIDIHVVYKIKSLQDEQSFSCEEDDDPEDDGLQYKYKAPEMPTREELAKLVLDYLICEGFREVTSFILSSPTYELVNHVQAAENLCEEMKLKVPEDLKVMDARVAIKDAIIEGNMEFAIDKVKQDSQLLRNR